MLGAALLREHMLYLPLGLFVLCAAVPAARSRCLWLPWLLVCAVWASAYALHARATGRSLLSAVPNHGVNGLSHLHSTLVTAQDLLGGMPWLPWVLLVCALGGAALARPSWWRLVLLWSAGALVALFLVAGPIGKFAGPPPGYWGWMLMPLVGALAPGVFALDRLARAKEPPGIA